VDDATAALLLETFHDCIVAPSVLLGHGPVRLREKKTSASSPRAPGSGPPTRA
jgi:hypothetical protein